jgi:hypothetical protein
LQFFNKKSKRSKKTKEFGKLKNEVFLFSWISEYFDKTPKSKSSYVLSNQICKDLDFEELFMYLDRTNSKIGQQYLYHQLRTFNNENAVSSEQEDFIRKIENDNQFRLLLETNLSKLDETEAFYIAKLFQDKVVEAPRWYKILPLLSVLSFISLVSLLFSTSLVYVLPVLIIINMGIHYRNKNHLDHYISSLSELIKLQSVAEAFKKYSSYIDVKDEIESSISILKKAKRHFYLFQVENKLQGDVTNLFWGSVEIIKILLVLEPIMFFRALDQIKNHQKQIGNLFNFIGRIDMLYSIASLRKGLGHFCKPNFHNMEKEIDVRSIYHPLIENCVRNDVNTSEKSILLTGSNMSGKSTFIRTIGVNFITSMALNTCFADSFQAPRMRLMSAVRISDDLMDEKSYYFEEVLCIKEMIQSSEEEFPFLFLLDELFKGTNTIERISAGKAVLSYLAENNNLVFVSTHDIELAELLKEEYDLYHFSEIISGDKVDFDYKLKEGKLTTRNAIKILDINQYPKSVIKEAKITAEILDVKKPPQ